MISFRPAVIALALLVSACAHNDLAGDAQPAPKAPPPIICADIEPPPDLEGGIPQPVTDEAREAVTLFLGATAELFSWGGRGWARAAKAKEAYCR